MAPPSALNSSSSCLAVGETVILLTLSVAIGTPTAWGGWSGSASVDDAEELRDARG